MVLSQYETVCGTRVWDRDVVSAGGRLLGAVRGLRQTATVSLASATASVAESAGSVSAAFVLTTSGGGPLVCPITVAYGTQPGTAAAGADYTAQTGTLTFVAGSATQATQSVSVPPDDRYGDRAGRRAALQREGPRDRAVVHARPFGPPPVPPPRPPRPPPPPVCPGSDPFAALGGGAPTGGWRPPGMACSAPAALVANARLVVTRDASSGRADDRQGLSHAEAAHPRGAGVIPVGRRSCSSRHVHLRGTGWALAGPGRLTLLEDPEGGSRVLSSAQNHVE